MSWNAGYITDVNYTFGYYSDFNPLRTDYALTMAGFATPALRNACELGFGQGLSIAMHAAAQPGVQWWGNDFNPAQAGLAQELAAQSGSGARLYDQAFDQFCSRDDLTEFEFIALHGIWSWVSDENRAIIVDFVRRKLAVGGVLYISYNTLPGWSIMAPVRHLMKQHADQQGGSGSRLGQRLGDAFSFLDELLAVQPIYAQAVPGIPGRIDVLKTMDRNYLVHEYMNRDWRPMYFSEVAEHLHEAKLTFAGSAGLLEQQQAVNLTNEQIGLLQAQDDTVFRETVRDFITAQQFRRDLWLRGARSLTSLEQAEALRAMRYLLTSPRGDVKLTMKGLQKEVTLHENVYAPILDFLADHQIKTFGQIEAVGAKVGINLAQVAVAMAILTGMGHVAVAQDDETIAKAKPVTDKLNMHLVQRSRSRSESAFLASPVTGGGVSVERLEQLLLAMRAQGRKTPADWAQSVHDLLAAQGQKLVVGGKTLETPEENLAELNNRAALLEKRLPILRSLGVA